MNLCILKDGELIVKKELPKGTVVLKEGTVLDPETSWSWEVVRKRRFSIRPDIQNDGEAYTKSLMLIGMKSIVIVPLLTRTGVIGTLNLGSRELGSYNGEHASFLQQVADQLALIIENARLYQEEILLKQKWKESYKMATELMAETEKRNLQLEIINQIAKSITVDMSFQDIIASITEKLNKVISYDFLSLCLLEEGKLVVKAAGPEGGNVYENIVLDQGSCPAKVIREKKIIVRYDTLNDHYCFSEDRELALKNIVSQIMVPLLVKGEAIGVLILGSKKPFAYNEEQGVFLQQVADQLSLCVKNFWLYSEESRNKRAWEEMFKAVTDILIVIDRKGNIIRFNKSAAEYVKESNVVPRVGQKCYDFFTPEQYDHILYPLNKVFKTKQPLHQRIHLHSGEIWDVSAYPIFNWIRYSKSIPDWYPEKSLS